MSKVVDFIFDCASPNAYLVHKVLPDLVTQAGAELNIVPCLLGGLFKATGNQAPMVAFANIRNRLDYDRLEFKRFVDKHRLSEFTFNPHFPVNTLLAMRGAVFARSEGYLDTYAGAVLHHMWEAPKKLDDPKVFEEALTESGFDGAAIVAATQDQNIKDELAANTQRAVERGAFGVPTFFVGDEMFFGKERLGQLAELLEGTKA